MKTEATGLYSRKAIERLGFTVAAEFLYADYEVQIRGNPPKLTTVLFSVGESGPDVFGPPGSGSVSTRYRSGCGSFYHH